MSVCTVILLQNDISEAAEVDTTLDMCLLISNLVNNEREQSQCPIDLNPFTSLLDSPLYSHASPDKQSVSSFNSSSYDSISNFDVEFDIGFLSDEEFDDTFIFEQDTLPLSKRKRLSRTRSFFNRLFSSIITKRRRRIAKNLHKKLTKGISCPLENATFVNDYLCD